MSKTIPKIIHYCWFGKNPKTELVKKCIKSWKKYLPDYKIREWNDKDLKNCDNQYVKEAYKAKKWAFITDYFRLYALYNYGGIYFDSDNEVFKSFDEFLDLDFFSGYEGCETAYYPFTAVLGAKKGHKIIENLLHEYDNLHFINPDGSLNLYTNTCRVTDYFQRKYKFSPPYDGNKLVTLENRCIIYPANIFCNYEQGVSYAVHHFSGSWVDKPKQKINILQNIFSVKNEYSNGVKRKIITILGLKIKFIPRVISLSYLKYYFNTKIKINKSLSFPIYNDYDVSIIIPVYNQYDYTLKCLNSIYKNTKNVKYEIILIDDCSTDKTKEIEKSVKNIKVIHNKENKGFIKNCNLAASYAKGKYIYLLNNDTVVMKNTIKELINVFDSVTNVGVVGSKIIDAKNYLIQSAGAYIDSDGNSVSIGYKCSPLERKYNIPKSVIYVCGASFMIPKDLWYKFNGLDEIFGMGYYEETDLCFRLRNAGYKIIYQPKSEILHYGGISFATRKDINFTDYPNKKLFMERWENLIINRGEKII